MSKKFCVVMAMHLAVDVCVEAEDADAAAQKALEMDENGDIRWEDELPQGEVEVVETIEESRELREQH